MNRLTPTAEQTALIEEILKAPYPVTFGIAARKLGTTPLEAARLMPESAVAFVEGDASERFADVWAALAQWEKATLFVVHAGNVFEIEGKISIGKAARGYYNILSKNTAIGGHINYLDLEAIVFASLPFMNRESLSVQFFNKAGEAAFAVYAGREKHKIIDSVREAFLAARRTFCGAAQ